MFSPHLQQSMALIVFACTFSYIFADILSIHLDYKCIHPSGRTEGALDEETISLGSTSSFAPPLQIEEVI